MVGNGAVGVAHAGWRGIVAGVIANTVDAIRLVAGDSAAPDYRAVIGPAIRPGAYEFGSAELAAVAEAARCDVGGVTSWGAPALDLVAAVRGALGTGGVGDVVDLGHDTAHADFFSHRVRGDHGRHATAVRLEER